MSDHYHVHVLEAMPDGRPKLRNGFARASSTHGPFDLAGALEYKGDNLPATIVRCDDPLC